MFKRFSILMLIWIFMNSVSFADYLICDPQPSDVVTKYKINLNGEILSAEIEKVGVDQVRLYYNIDHLSNGKHNATAAAGNDKEEWSEWSKALEFYRGIPTPQTISLYCISEESAKISQQDWKVIHVNSEEKEHGKFGILAIDGDVNTHWHTEWTSTDPDTKHPHEIQIDLGKIYRINGFSYLSRQDKSWNGTIKRYIFYTSLDGINWTEVSTGELAKTKDEQLIEFHSQNARYVSLVALSEVNENVWTTVAELNILGY